MIPTFRLPQRILPLFRGRRVTRVKPVEVELPLQDLLDERALDIPDRLLNLLPVGIYFCDGDGLVVRYNRAAAELWGCSPRIGDLAVRYCGSYRLYRLDGDYVPHASRTQHELIESTEAEIDAFEARIETAYRRYCAHLDGEDVPEPPARRIAAAGRKR